jgi:tRNA threonylcarbamoyladenosine dehydratase
MMEHPQWLQRTHLLLGDEKLERLRKLNILIVGLGGVGSYAAEFLARAGVGKMTIVDGDVVDLSNTNRQLPAMHSTVNQPKAHLMAQRIRDINPDIDLTVLQEFLEPKNVDALVSTDFDYVFDCIDSVQPKQYLIVNCKQKGVRIISSMGAGGRIDPSKVKIDDISKTFNCPFAQQVRKGLKKKGLRRGVTCVFSSELVSRDTCMHTTDSKFKISFYGTISYIPALFGLQMASVVVQEVSAGAPIFLMKIKT